MIKPYPREWPRVLDFLPPLGLQVALDKDLELYYCVARVSIQKQKMPLRPVETELGVNISVDNTSGNTVVAKYGTPTPTTDAPTQKELLENVVENVPVDFPDIVIKKRGVVEKIPKILEDHESFQGVEDIFYQQTSRGNYTRMLRRAFHLPIQNPFYFVKGPLLEHKIIKSPRDPIFRKIRSTLKTEWVKTDVSGYLEFGRTGVFDLGKALSGKKWWQDIGLVHPIEARINSSLYKGNIYLLWKRRELIAS